MCGFDPLRRHHKNKGLFHYVAGVFFYENPARHSIDRPFQFLVQAGEVAAPAAAGLDTYKRETGEQRLQQLHIRLDALNQDITTKGMLHVKGRPEPLLTGYAYGEFYDWDLYFENLYLSYYGISDYCFSNFKAFMALQKPDGFVSREDQETKPADVQAVSGTDCGPRLETEGE